MQIVILNDDHMNMDLHKKFFGRSRYDSKKESINVVASIAKCRTLYKDLIIEAHPDRHPEKVDLANEISQMINENRHNYSKLIELKSRIAAELL